MSEKPLKILLIYNYAEKSHLIKEIKIILHQID